MNAIKYPNITVRQDGAEAFGLLARVKVALVTGGVSREAIDAFVEEAMAGSYYHMLTTIKQTVVLV